jgi:mRNA interferase MazF
LVTIALQGDYGKPRPALIVQSDLFDEHPSVTVLPVTGALRDAPLFRIRIEPEPANNLQKTSEIMVDKPQSVPRERVGEVFGHVTEEQMLAVSRSMAVFLGVI